MAHHQPYLSAPPGDTKMIKDILEDMGVHSADPKVIDMLIEFIHTYTSGVLQDAQIYQAHRQAPVMSQEDVRLAVQSRMNNSYSQPPPRELLLELARERNSHPLEAVPPSFGVQLPPEQHQLTAPNYKLELNK